ncbi:MAG: c-type cytochrome [Cyanobacteria bacterium HKST-UBA02]|nr:c-type cytochrome [Cyanobacteria bacterium HKST-UBA02]
MTRKLLVLFMMIAVPAAMAAKSGEKKAPDGKKLFKTHCASCHQGGGNLVKPGKPIKGSNVLVTYATFKAYLNEPLGDMPHYEHLISNDDLLTPLYLYVKKLGKEEPKKDAPAKKPAGDPKKKSK